MVEPKYNDGVSLWQDEAKCVGEKPTVFFTLSNKEAEQNKTFCNDCPVKAACLEYALVYNMCGVWGGTTDRDRDKISPVSKQMLRDDTIESGMYLFRTRS